MTKEELKVKVSKQLSIINDANNQICSDVKEYIESLPYKVGDKVSCSRCNACWIASIIPERNCARYSRKLMNHLTRLAGKTPFEIRDILSSANKLKRYDL